MGRASEGLSVDDELSYLREFEHITLARILLAEAGESMRPSSSWTGSSRRPRQAAGPAPSSRSCVLQALAHQHEATSSAALVPLERGARAGRAGGLRPDCSSTRARRWRRCWRRPRTEGSRRAYVRRLLAAFADDAAPRPERPPRGLVDPLSEREQDVLRLLATELSGPEIARELVVSLNTVRTHTKNIYAKLGVNSRRTAVRRAQELGLLVSLGSDRITTSFTTRGDPRSPHPSLASGAWQTADTEGSRDRSLRDPAPGAPRRPMGSLVRRTDPQQRERRHHRDPRRGRRPVSPPRAAAEGA